jgi:predicted nucleic acid-binding Zn ribbon protein
LADLSASDLARALSAHRKHVTKACVVCGREFVGLTKSRFCSNACKLRDYRKRKSAELRNPATPKVQLGAGRH